MNLKIQLQHALQINDFDLLLTQEWNVCPVTWISSETRSCMCEFSVLHIGESISVCDEESSLLGCVPNKFQALNLQQISLWETEISQWCL
jgi:hypothetical protein